MSRNRSYQPVPRGGIGPIECAHDALAVLGLGAPYGHDTIVILLDADRCGCSVMVVTNTFDTDALFRVIDEPERCAVSGFNAHGARSPMIRARRSAGLSRRPAPRSRRTSSRLSTCSAPAATSSARCSSGMS